MQRTGVVEYLGLAIPEADLAIEGQHGRQVAGRTVVIAGHPAQHPESVQALRLTVAITEIVIYAQRVRPASNAPGSLRPGIVRPDLDEPAGLTLAVAELDRDAHGPLQRFHRAVKVSRPAADIPQVVVGVQLREPVADAGGDAQRGLQRRLCTRR